MFGQLTHRLMHCVPSSSCTIAPKEQLQKMLCEFKKSTKKVDSGFIQKRRKFSATKARNRAVWAPYHKYRQELTSKNNTLKHRPRLFDAVISPTICYASGTWTPTKEHERMIQPTQRKMPRLIIQTKRRYKKTAKQKDKTNEAKDTNDPKNVKTGKAQTLTKTRTATRHPRTTQKMKSILQRLKKKIGSTT